LASGQSRSESTSQNDPNKYEERSLSRLVERAVRADRSERARWLKELTKAFPDRVGPGKTEDELGQWFGLLAGGGSEWRRDKAPTKEVAELFDRAVRRLELGPVPSIRREEFLRFARRSLRPGDEREAPDPGPEADRVFRVLDRDGDGRLEQTEWTIRLRADRRVDANRDGRVSPDEYRTCFAGWVTAAVEAASDPKRAAPGGPGSPDGLPGWFAKLDEDEDGQVGLYEWRQAGRPTAEFLQMDLNGDGLLPPAEYLRYARTSDPDGPPPPPTSPGSKPKK
jgi:hypothetical protein